MREFDAIIGYEDIKRELEQTADILRNVGKYKTAGAKVPAGMLIHGDPGLGKSLMAECLIAASGLPHFTCRKDKTDGEFVDSIRQVFDEAAAKAPSIVYLDDMDKFANADDRHRNAEEYVAVQSCIDSVKGKDVFVLATTNELDCLPSSLTRPGRFDRRVNVYTPEGKDAEAIIKGFLRGRPLADDVLWDDVAMLMDGCSCAQLESALNEALLISISKDEELISKESFMEAFFKTRLNLYSFGGISAMASSEKKRRAVHEAGHAAIYEVLVGKTVSLVTVSMDCYGRGGVCSGHKPTDCSNDVWNDVNLMAGMGGRAASEVFFGAPDEGSSEDLRRVTRLVMEKAEAASIPGSPLATPAPYQMSDDFKQRMERLADAEMRRYYRKAKEIISANREFVEKLADAIAVNEYLVSSDIQAIKETCGIASGSWSWRLPM